ncbi:hypothetical protein KBY58_06890 [Cyanobium sp. HWJ4-Hawea]|nr:hypothetical protein [Cyanobium sp. HWJ4-Hawea]
MPDFEALVRRQQEHQSAAAERLGPPTPVAPASQAPASQAVGTPIGILAFAGGLVGALIGTVGLQWAMAQGWISF